MRNRLPLGLQLALLTLLSSVVHGQNEHPLTAPDSVILSGWEYGDLFVTTPAGSFPVQGPPGFSDRGYFVIPALAPGGDRIAWGLTLPDDSDRTKCDPSIVTCALPGRTQYKSVMGVYSLRDKTWKTYGDFCQMGAGSAVFSPDGTKIAFKAQVRADEHSSCDSGYSMSALLILDLVSSQFTQVPNTSMVMANARISWSPDGKYLAVQFGAWGPPNSIVLIEVGSWVQKPIADGWNPSWSPKGDWIAYEIDGGTKCMIAHPDGIDAKLILDVGHRSGLGGWQLPMGAAWSPDETTLWLSEQEFSGKTEVVRVDLATGEVNKMPKNTPSVFGWVLQPGDPTASAVRRSGSAPER
jgi:Tol biopolymer transport system component